MAKRRRNVVTHTFKGPRFDDHGLDVDVLPDLLAYKVLLVETAKELWRRKHPDRQRLPRGFEDSLTLKFYELQAGSTRVPLVREIEYGDGELEFEPPRDELDEAVTLIADTIDAAAAGSQLPEELPKNVIPLFSNYGRTLGEGESFEHIIPNRPKPACYNVHVRDEVIRRAQGVYEDHVDLVGEVRAADLDGCNFTLRLDDGAKIPGKFTPDQEALIVEALREHATQRLKLTGRGEFDPLTRALKRVVSVTRLCVQAPGEPVFDASATPIWEVVAGISATVPDEEWASEPTDVSKRVDHYLRGSAEDEV